PLLQRVPRRLAFAPVLQVVDEVVAVLVLRPPDEGEQPLLVGAASDIRTGAGAALQLRGRAPLRRLAVEPGNLRLARGEGALVHRARRVHGDGGDARTGVARQVGGG